jgi:hypothetical protein
VLALERRALRLQLAVSQLFMAATYTAVLGWMRVFRRYRIEDLRRVRARCDELMRSGEGPVIICANHLTMIDSFILIWALSSLSRCLRSSSRFPWNLPEQRNFYTNFGLRALCYLGKCIPVLRGGPAEKSKLVLAKVGYLMSVGETLMVFPEGGRSRTGRVDAENFAYAVGTMIQQAPGGEARVLCVYLRGNAQADYSDFPVKGECFRIDLELLRPRSEHAGLRGARDIATQIIRRLSRMEQDYFGRRAAL